jgi:hypothetical protein
MIEVKDTFNPVNYSESECKFLIAHLGESPVVALEQVPTDVVVQAVQPALERVYELSERERYQREGDKWVGVQAVKDACSIYLFQLDKWRKDHKRGAPAAPPMYSFDSRGRAHRGGIGSDSGMIHSYFAPDGTRLPFTINLFSNDQVAWTPEWVGHGTDEPTAGLKVDAVNQRIECLVCGHTEHYNLDSRSSYNAARARISKHLRTAKDETERHREVHTNEFGGGDR